MNHAHGLHVNRYFRDSVGQAFASLRDNRLRTFLSIIGIAVGVAAVVAVGTVAKAGRDYVFKEFQTFGLTTMWVYRFLEEENPYYARRAGSGITSDDLDALPGAGCCPDVTRISPWVYTSEWKVLVRTGNMFANVRVDGVGLDYMSINNDEIAYGRGFREDDMAQRKPAAIIGPAVAEKFFGSHINPIGESLRMGEMRLTVIGVLAPKDRKFLMKIGAVGFDINERILIPYTLYQQVLDSKDVHTLVAEATSLEVVDKARDEVVNYLTRRHNYKFNYVGETMTGWIATADKYLWQITWFGIFAASVSLFVGGLGIFNIMSTSVTERTREIGIRKAIGARQKDILTQFLIEAVTISALGSLAGLAAMTIIFVLVAVLTDFTLIPSILLVVVAVVISCFVGIASGFFPARRAARLRPVDALRYE